MKCRTFYRVHFKLESVKYAGGNIKESPGSSSTHTYQSELIITAKRYQDTLIEQSSTLECTCSFIRVLDIWSKLQSI